MLALHRAKSINVPKRKTIPHSLLFLDTETIEQDETSDTKQLVFKSGCMIFVELDDKLLIKSREVYNIYEIEDFYDYLEQLSITHNNISIFAHNLGFDLRILHCFHRLSADGWKSKAPIINNRLFLWTLRYNHRVLDFVDTANLGVSTVEELGRIIGKPKLDIDFNIATKLELEMYCQRDCEIIEEFVIEYLRFLLHYSLGGFKKTIASQALHTYLYRFYRNDIFPHRLPSILELENEGYHGGRTEAFYIGKLPTDNYTLLDINSMYASILASCAMPANLISFKSGTISKIPDKIMEHHYVIAKVILRTKVPAYPKIIDNRLCFPTGVFSTVLHHAELSYACKRGDVLRVLCYAAYTKVKVFTDYANFFLNERSKHKATGNTIWDDICKKFNNSLYGKMAQHGYRRKTIDRVSTELFGRLPYNDHIRNTHGQFIIWNGQVIDEYRQGLARHSCMAIAGAVTAYGRMILFELGTVAGLENWFYCDTDSLMVNSQGFENLKGYIEPTEVGKLKVVSISENVYIHGAKDYKFGDIERIKGIKSKAVRLKEDTFEQWNFQSVLAWLNGGGQGTVRLTRVVKHRKSEYKKGKLSEYKYGRVTPFCLDG